MSIRAQVVVAMIFALGLVCVPAMAQNFGGWSDAEILDNTLNYSAVEVADVNGDYYMDLATMIYSNDVPGQQRSIPAFWTYDADMDMFDPMPLLGAFRPHGGFVIDAFDMDGDDDDDMLVGNIVLNSAGWYENDGTDSPAGDLITSGVSGIHDIAGGDFDGDGDADAVFSRRETDVVYFAERDGDNWILHEYPVQAGNDPEDIEVADIDMDGDLDVMVANSWRGGVRMMVNDGTGTFTWQPIFVPGGSIGAIALLDADNDGDYDMVASMPDSGRVMLIVQGASSFVEVTLDDNLYNINEIRAADVDFDGDDDLMMISTADAAIVGFENRGSYQFERSDVANVTGTPVDIELLDADMDDDLDLVVATPDAGLHMYYTTSLKPFITKSVMGMVGTAREIEAADMDSDGDMDICISTMEDNFYLLENMGIDGWMSHDLVMGQPTPDFLLNDWDDDGLMDIIAADYSVDELVFWRQTGSLAFERIVLASIVAPELLEFSDLSGDGLNDIIVGYDLGFDWFEQVTPTNLVRYEIAEYAQTTVALIKAGDFNGDGLPDLLNSRANGPSRYLTLMVNDGVGGFNNFALDDHIMSEGFFVELSGDDNLDLLTGFDDEFNWYRNNDPGYTIFHLNVPSSHLDHSYADIDLDGDNDPVVLWSDPMGLYVLNNDGTGSFTQSPVARNIGLANVVTTADMDGDGDMDFVVGQDDVDGGVFWIENQVADFATSIAGSKAAEEVLMADSNKPVESDFGLFASPNPFNASTTLQMTLPEAGEMKVQIFDVTGRLVATLANGTYQPGTHRLNWNAQNHASGMYFVRATALGQTPQVRKLMLVR